MSTRFLYLLLCILLFQACGNSKNEVQRLLYGHTYHSIYYVVDQSGYNVYYIKFTDQNYGIETVSNEDTTRITTWFKIGNEYTSLFDYTLSGENIQSKNWKGRVSNDTLYLKLLHANIPESKYYDLILVK